MIRGFKLVAAAGIFLSSAAFTARNCPIDNLTMYFTGNTQITSGVLLKEYRCARGHTAWGR
jgi:uncharacterized ferredoxin-like protein